MEKNFNIDTDKIGNDVEKTTTYLKKLSDYIERKLYDSKGNLKEGGVKSLSLSFAMLVGFSMAILIVSTIAISFIILTKNETILATKRDLIEIKIELKKTDNQLDQWKDRYNNVYSKCDSIGYARARAALEFSQSLKVDVDATKSQIKSVVSQKVKETQDLKKLNNDVKSIHSNL